MHKAYTNIQAVTFLGLLLVLLQLAVPNISLVKEALYSTVFPSVLAELTNVDRETKKLPSLTINPLLQKAAQLKANDMAEKSYFAHISPQGRTPWFWLRKVGYNYHNAGENLAVRFLDSTNVNDAWMNSTEHRNNILSSKYSEVGIATAKGIYKGKETEFVVQMFGDPKK